MATPPKPAPAKPAATINRRLLPLTKVFRLAAGTLSANADYTPGNAGPFTLQDVAFCVVDVATGNVVDDEPILRLSMYDVAKSADVSNGDLPLNVLRKLATYRLPNPINFGIGNTIRCRLSTDAAAVASTTYDVYVTLLGEQG